jgi:IPP transferase
MHRYSNFTWWMRRPPARRRAVAIYGPTSSGKTALSLDVCEAASERGLRPVVLNADSRQVYAGMDIGTSKIKRSEMRGFEHRLLDVAEPSSKLSLEAYARLARDELASLAASEDALPVLVGGTGVYVQSVLDGWDLTGTGTLRRSLERDFPRSDVTGAHQVLARLAPEVARRVHPSNYEAILNALVRRMTGEASNEVATPFAFTVYGVDRGERRPTGGSRQRWTPRSATGCWRRSPSSTAGTGSSSRLAGRGAAAMWRRRHMGIASSSTWPRRPGSRSRNSTAPTLLPPEPKRSATSGRTRDGSGRGSANLARCGSTIDQR